ncbi:MAG: DciA family protein [Microthrixaceae bacterium]
MAEGSMRRLGDSVDRLRRGLGLVPLDSLDRLRLAWPEVVGEGPASRSTPVAVRNGVLRVEAVDAATAEALRWAERRTCRAVSGLLAQVAHDQGGRADRVDALNVTIRRPGRRASEPWGP